MTLCGVGDVAQDRCDVDAFAVVTAVILAEPLHGRKLLRAASPVKLGACRRHGGTQQQGRTMALLTELGNPLRRRFYKESAPVVLMPVLGRGLSCCNAGLSGMS